MRLVLHPPRLIPHDALSQISTGYVDLVLLCAFPEKGRAVGRIAEMCLCWWRCICSHPCVHGAGCGTEVLSGAGGMVSIGGVEGVGGGEGVGRWRGIGDKEQESDGL